MRRTRGICGLLRARASPGERRQANKLPDQVRRQHQEPRNGVAISNFSAQRSEKITVAMSAIVSKDLLAHQVNAKRHQYETNEQQSEKESRFPSSDMLKRITVVGHVSESGASTRSIVAYRLAKIKFEQYYSASSSARLRRRNISKPMCRHIAENSRYCGNIQIQLPTYRVAISAPIPEAR